MINRKCKSGPSLLNTSDATSLAAISEKFSHLLQSSNVIEASSSDFADVVLHRQFTVQGDPK